MSKRHQSSRRKVYGRRQHELRERQDREHHHDGFELVLEDRGPTAPSDPLAFLDARSSRFRYAVAD